MSKIARKDTFVKQFLQFDVERFNKLIMCN